MQKIIVPLLLLITASLISISCDKPAEKMLRLGTNVWPGYEPLYMARDKGYLQKGKVHLVEYSSTSQTLQAYRNGLIDAAGVTLDEAMLLLATGENPKIILVTNISDGGDVIIAHPYIENLQDIKGKRIGVEGNALGAYMMSRALEQAGLDRTSITVVQKSIDEHEQAFTQKQVDAVVTFEPIKSKLLAFGGRQLFSSKQIPGEIVDVIIVRDEYLQQHKETAQHLIDQWYRTLKEIEKQPQNSAILLGRRMKLNIEQTLGAYQGLKLPNREENNQLLYSLSSNSLVNIAQRLIKIMQSNQLIKAGINPDLLFLQEPLSN